MNFKLLNFKISLKGRKSKVQLHLIHFALSSLSPSLSPSLEENKFHFNSSLSVHCLCASEFVFTFADLRSKWDQISLVFLLSIFFMQQGRFFLLRKDWKWFKMFFLLMRQCNFGISILLGQKDFKKQFQAQ